MLWDSCAVSGKENLAWVHELMKKENYDGYIIKDNVKKSAASLALGHRWVFQQDNQSKHTSKSRSKSF